MNHFYKMWEDASRGRNDYTTNEVHWSQVPGRDAKWKEETIKNTSPRQFAQEFECDFLGSADTLISPSKLQNIPFHDPIASNAGKTSYGRWKALISKVLNFFNRSHHFFQIHAFVGFRIQEFVGHRLILLRQFFHDLF